MRISFLALLVLVCGGCATRSPELISGHQPVPRRGSELAGKVVVITGASSGFGRGVARQVAAQGGRVVLAARRTAVLEELARECGPGSVAVTTDVSRPADVERLARTAVARCGHVDVWINDAGVASLGRFEEVPLRDQQQTVETNLLGEIYGSWYALREFRRQHHGTLINVASIAGKISLPYYSVYSATKFGIVGLDASLREEQRLAGEKDIHVCTVLPLANDTPFFTHAGNYTGHTLRASPVYDPSDTVETIVSLIRHPRDEVTPHLTGRLAMSLNQLAPRVVEHLLANQTDAGRKAAPPAAATSGNVQRSASRESEVQGTMRARVAAEKQAR